METSRARRPSRAALALALVAALHGAATAQIGNEAASVVVALQDYGPEPDGTGHETAAGFAIDVEETLDTSVAGPGEGEHTHDHDVFMRALVGPPSRYGRGI